MFNFKNFALWLIFFFLGFSSLAHTQSVAQKDSSVLRPKVKAPVVDRWIAPDKGLHLLGSMMLTIAGTKTLQQNYGFKYHSGMKWAMGFTFCLGVGKEVRDSRQPHNIFSWKDLSADVLGIFLGRCILEIK